MLFSPIARCFWLFLSVEGVGLADPLPIGFLKALGLREGLMLQPTLSISANDASQLSGVILGRLRHYFICAEILETDAPPLSSLSPSSSVWPPWHLLRE